MITLQSRIKQLFKDSAIYGFGSIAASGIGFILLPLYTRVFNPAEYGEIEMLNIINSFIGPILTMGMDSAQSYFFFKQKEKGQKAQAEVITGILQWRLTWGTLIIALTLIISPFLNKQFFDNQLTWVYFLVAILWMFFSQLMSQSQEALRYLYRPWSFISVSLGNTIISVVFVVLFIARFDWGMMGYFIGFSLGSLTFAIFGWWSIREYVDWSKWHFGMWPKLLKFGAPFVPVALFLYALETTDRWFISHFQGLTELGVYAIADKFAMVFTLITITFRLAWWPIAMDAIHSPDGPALLRIISRLYLGLGCIGIVLLTAVSPLLLKWFTTPSYYIAYPLIGVLAFQPLNHGFQAIVGIGIWKREKTTWTFVTIGIAVVVSIIFSFVLVPLFGNMGAAIAMGLGYFVWSGATLLLSEKLWPVGFPFWVFSVQILLAIISVIGINLISSGENWKVILIALISCIAILGVTIKRSQLEWVIDELQSRNILKK